MRTRLIIAVVLIALAQQLLFAACKKTERTEAKPPSSEQAHEQEMVRKSFAESKKAVAASVNGETITMFTLLREMNTIAPQYPAREPGKELDARIRKDALNTLIVQELAVQEARKRGMRVKPEVLDAEMKKIKTKTGSEEAYQQYLAQQGLTDTEFRQMIEQDALFEMIAEQEIDKKTTVTDVMLKERYEKEKAGSKDAAHRQMNFEEAKGMLEQKIRAEAAEKRMREWEKELRKKAVIRISEPKPGPEANP
jgi:SurA-like protein